MVLVHVPFAYSLPPGSGSGGKSGGLTSSQRTAVAAKVRATIANLGQHVINSMVKRGWTSQEILDAVDNGDAYPAIDNTTGGQPATRFVNPTTGKSVVVNDATGVVIHVGGIGFKY